MGANTQGIHPLVREFDRVCRAGLRTECYYVLRDALNRMAREADAAREKEDDDGRPIERNTGG